MAKSSNQKGRILAVRELLHRQTDETHLLTIPQITESLAKQDIQVERKSLYDDIDALIAAGDDIQLRRGRGGGYFIGGRLFELSELKLLVDAVQSSRFITERKSNQLIRKLESLASIWQAQQLQRQVVIRGRIKNMNETIYYAVDTIQTAIAQDKKLRFQYDNWEVDFSAPGGFTSRPRHNGRQYIVSPWALVWMEENYYLIGFEQNSGEIRHYRVDKMHDQHPMSQRRDGREAFDTFDLPSYTQALFGMFSGTPQDVCIEAQNDLAHVFIDRFGRDLILLPGEAENTFRVHLRVVPGPTFYGWMMSFGSDARLVSPSGLQQRLAAQARAVAAQYTEE